MRKTVPITVLTIGLGCFSISPATANGHDPCHDKQSNREMRECYATQQGRANAEADALANKIVSEFREEAQDASDGTVANDLMRKTAAARGFTKKLEKLP